MTTGSGTPTRPSAGPQRAGTQPEAQSGTPANGALHRFSLLVAVCTGILVFAGGLVKSLEAGLSVPDWPLSYGQVMPPMVGNIRFEHGHRMIATAVGMLTIILAVWLARRESRPWVRKLGWAALGAVVLQGVLGGITVLLFLPAPVSVAHGTLAQTYFCIVVAIALFTSPGWQAPVAPREEHGGPSLRTLALVTTGAVYVQLILGATMRHLEAGLAIPDWPLAFGRLVPPFDAPGVGIHFAHRIGSLVVAACAAYTVGRVLARHRDQPALVAPAVVLATLVVTQFVLGATTVWSGKAVVPTTLHVLNGALVLVTSLVLTLRSFKFVVPEHRALAYRPLPTERVAT